MTVRSSAAITTAKVSSRNKNNNSNNNGTLLRGRNLSTSQLVITPSRQQTRVAMTVGSILTNLFDKPTPSSSGALRSTVSDLPPVMHYYPSESLSHLPPSPSTHHQEVVSEGDNSIEILPIPLVGSSFLLFCVAVLFVSLYYHCRSADRRHISWLRTKPHAITAMPVGPGQVKVVADNYEYTCSQIKHQLTIDDENKKTTSRKGGNKRRGLLSFLRKGRRKGSRLLESGGLALMNVENSATAYSTCDNDGFNDCGSRNKPPSLTGEAIGEEDFDNTCVTNKNNDEQIIDLTEPSVTDEAGNAVQLSSSFCGPLESSVANQLDLLDSSYWSYEQRRFSITSGPSGAASSRLNSQQSDDGGLQMSLSHHQPPLQSPSNKMALQSTSSHRNGSSSSSTATHTPDVRRSSRLAYQQHPQPSIDSRTSVHSAVSTLSAFSNLIVPATVHSTTTSQQQALLSRQQSLRVRGAGETGDSCMTRGKTYTGLLSLTRLHALLQNRHDNANPTMGPHHRSKYPVGTTPQQLHLASTIAGTSHRSPHRQASIDAVPSAVTPSSSHHRQPNLSSQSNNALTTHLRPSLPLSPVNSCAGNTPV